jgi:hypothetical protein
MDDFAAEMLASTHDDDHQVPPSSLPSGAAAPVGVEPDPVTPPRQGGLRGGLAAIREKASLQDRLVEKYCRPTLALQFHTNS